MARIQYGFMSKREVGRGGGAPGANARDVDGQQDAAIGKRAKDYMAKGKTSDGATATKLNVKTLIDSLEEGKSMSADKKRERGRSKLQYPNSKQDD